MRHFFSRHRNVAQENMQRTNLENYGMPPHEKNSSQASSTHWKVMLNKLNLFEQLYTEAGTHHLVDTIP